MDALHTRVFSLHLCCVQQELFLLSHSNIDWQAFGGVRADHFHNGTAYRKCSSLENCAKTPAFCVRSFCSAHFTQFVCFNRFKNDEHN